MHYYQFTLEMMWNLFSRGFLLCFLLIMTLYFAVLKKEKAKFSYTFAFCQVTLLISLILGTVMRTYNIIGMTPEVEGMLDLMIVPSFMEFFYTMVNQNVSWRKIILSLFLIELPIALGAIWFIYTRNPLHQTYVGIYILIFCVAGLIWSIFRVRRFNRDLNNSYADNDDRNLLWYNAVAITMIAFFGTYLLVDLMFNYDNSPLLQSLYFIIIEVCMIVIAYFVNKQKTVDTDIMKEVVTNDTDSTDSNNSNEIGENVIAEIKEKLEDVFEKKELYRQQNINIKNVAHMLGTNVRYVSICINTEYGKNFNQYINDLRLNKAKGILLSDDNLTMDEVAHQLGFSSKATFWRVFQIEYGCSPNQFRSRERESEITINPPGEPQEKQEKPAYPTMDFSLLSKRELELCELIKEGTSIEEQIEKMGISRSSLIVMKSRLKKKLGLERKESLRKALLSVN